MPTSNPTETPTPTRGPTRTPHATSTPQPPSPLAGLENGNWLEQNKRARAAEIRQLEWVADGVDDSEKDAAELLIAAARWYPDVFRALIEKPWVQDSITAAEADAISRLRWMPRYTPGQVDQVLVMPWVQDDISRDEATIIQSLYWISRPNDEAFKEHVTDAAIDILSMPFLESIHGPDAPAVRSLQRLERVDSAGFLEVMAHPKVVDGISDEEAKVVALLGGTYPYRPQSVDFLLGGTGVYLEERVIELPLTGETLLAIIRIRDQVTPNMDFLEHSVRTIEQFMNEPLPTNYVAWYFDDVKATAGGTNFGTHIASKLYYDIEHGPSWSRAPFHIAHEVGHYYWRGRTYKWVTEGAADLLGSVSENARVDKPVEISRNPCASAATISELEGLDAEYGTNAAECFYSLGESLYMDLYNTLGTESFRQGFRNLYRKSLVDDPADDCQGTDLDICHLSAAFKTEAPDDVADQVDEIVERWYGPVP